MDDDARRQRYERLILIAIIVGPLTLWFFKNGMHWVAAEWAKTVALAIASFSTAALSQFFVALALLMSWRRPMTGRHVGAIALATLMSIIGVRVVNEVVLAILYPSYASWSLWWSVEGSAFLIQELIAILVSLACFALLRRTAGFCIVDEDLHELPPKASLSIAELLYWTSGFAVVFSLVPLLSEYSSRSGNTWSHGMLVLAFAIESSIRVTPVLIIAAIRWRLPYRIVFAATCVVACKAGQMWFYQRYAGFAFALEYWPIICDACFSVAGAILALFWFWWHGEKLVRLSRKKQLMM